MDGNLDGKESALQPEQFGAQVVGFAHYPGGKSVWNLYGRRIGR